MARRSAGENSLELPPARLYGVAVVVAEPGDRGAGGVEQLQDAVEVVIAGAVDVEEDAGPAAEVEFVPIFPRVRREVAIDGEPVRQVRAEDVAGRNRDQADGV